jgi:hypothetical protein
MTGSMGWNECHSVAAFLAEVSIAASAAFQHAAKVNRAHPSIVPAANKCCRERLRWNGCSNGKTTGLKESAQCSIEYNAAN